MTQRVARMRKKILVVDDEPDLLFVMSLALRHGGYDVITAQDGFAALEEIAQSMPDVLVTDLMMPAMSGGQLVERVRLVPLGKALPILVVTAGGSAPPAGTEVLHKPFGAGELLDRVKRLLGQVRLRVV